MHTLIEYRVKQLKNVYKFSTEVIVVSINGLEGH